MAGYRIRLVVPVGIVALVLLTLFAVNNLLHGRLAVGLIIVIAEISLLADVLALRKGKALPVPLSVVVVAMVATMLFVVVRQGIYGVLWGYPIVLICYFALSRRLALLFSLGVLIMLTLFVALWIDRWLSVRVFATLLLTIVMINFVLNIAGELQRALMRQALTDSLTGAFNRHRMEQVLEQVVELGGRRAPNDTILMMDIDHFKSINDRLGHEAGDRVLRQMVSVINDRKRKTDMLFRIGGDEFMILLFETNATGAAVLANDLRLSIEQAPLMQGQKVT